MNRVKLEKGVVNPKKGGPNDKFEAAFDPILVDISTLVLPRKHHPGEKSGPVTRIQEWLKFVVEYNVPQGKQIRGRMVEQTYTLLRGKASDAQVETSRQLGWIVEIIQAACLVADDIMDHGKMRRGQICWHRLPVVGGSAAVNDAFLLEHLAFKLLEKYFGDATIYAELVKLFHTVIFNTVVGQSLDTRIGLTSPNFENYDESVYNFIVTHKTAYYTFYLPIACGMLLAGIPKSRPQLWESVEKIAMQMGTLFQIQDDLLDNFGEEWVTGKVGTDIPEGKCTWLFLQAKKRCSPEELSVLLNNYGDADERKVKAVKDLYATLNLKKVFFQKGEKIRNNIYADIEKIEGENLRLVLKKILFLIHDRAY